MNGPDLPGRRDRVAARLAAAGVDALVVGPSDDFRYLTGVRAHVSERLVALLLRADGTAVVVAPLLEADMFSELPEGMDLALWADGEDAGTALWRQGEGAASIAIDPAWPASHLLALMERAGRGVRYVVDASVAQARAVKDAHEISLLRRAAVLADEVLQSVARSVTGAETELELNERVNAGFRGAEGVRGEMFGLVASGERSAHPHHYPQDVAIDGALLLDIGARVDGYWSDTSRTFVLGTATPELARVHEVVLRAQTAAIAAVGPGIRAEEVDAVARAVITAEGYGGRFLHRTGHGIGLSMHEPPFLVAGDVTVLEPGHVITVEPGIYLEGIGGVRIEDVVVVTADGCERLNVAPRGLRQLAVVAH